MVNENSFIPTRLAISQNRRLSEALYFGYGVGLLILLTQIQMPLSWTPVPITGQTMGVTLLSLLWGRRRAPMIVCTYIFLSALGLPLLAGKTSLSIGPTNGYLLGMVIASYWMGYLADRGLTKNFWMCWLSGVSGSAIILSVGTLGLLPYVPLDKVLWAGVFPFLPGDFVKTLTACSMVYRAQKTAREQTPDIPR